MNQLHSVERSEQGVRLRAEIEASIPTEEVKLRDGPYDGVTAHVPLGESRLTITQSSFTTSQFPPPVIAYEYQRDPKPQFRYVKQEGFNPVSEPTVGVLVDDSDFREGFYRGLHRAASLLIIKSRQLDGQKNWGGSQACEDVVDKLREAADALGFQRSDLYSLYPGDEKLLEKK